MSIDECIISITSGSFGEGLDMRGSDLDIMFVKRNMEVCNLKPRLNPNISYLSMDTEDVKPGFTQLRLEYCSDQTLFENCVQFANKHYLSSTLWKLQFSEELNIHGPCLSDEDGLADFADCLHCKTNNVGLNFSFNRGIQKIVSCYKSSIQYLFTYYTSLFCSVRAQYIPLHSAYSNNKYLYGQYKSCLCTLLQNIYHDAVTGWLMLASFFYKTKQYAKAVRIIMHSISKCTFEKLYFEMKMSDIHHRLFKLKSLQKMGIVQLWKYVLVDDIRFEINSLLIPDELLIEVGDNPLRIPSSVYACFLCFLCHYHLNDARQCRDTLQVLQLVTECNYLNADLDAKAAAYNLLGVALQTVGDTKSARQAYLQSAELYIDPSDNPAVERLFLLD
ncbi:unnamed protein product [Mytilus coruscus]|uniref:Uncharacterized protein n=1 Tax=Mytilus coruscus TaxID=42192 RepID=A0A6J8ADY1_MYTCO|nr:unnamed protein product [Mytilus coruscus]